MIAWSCRSEAEAIEAELSAHRDKIAAAKSALESALKAKSKGKSKAPPEAPAEQAEVRGVEGLGRVLRGGGILKAEGERARDGSTHDRLRLSCIVRGACAVNDRCVCHGVFRQLDRLEKELVQLQGGTGVGTELLQKALQWR